MSDSVSAFLTRFPPAHTAPVSPDLLERYAPLLPEEVLEVWRAGGLGTYGGGLLEVIDPDDYQEILNGWLGLDAGVRTRIPFLRSAFGVLFYWRLLGERQPDGSYEAYDVAYLNPHDSSSGVSAWGAAEFFGEAMLDEAAEDEFDPYWLWSDVQDRAAADLHPGVMYGFRLALRLGGDRVAENVVPMSAREHLWLLLALVDDGDGEGGLTADPDADVTFAAEFDAREAQLRAQIAGTDDVAVQVHLHQRLAALLRRYPWHELPGNTLDKLLALGGRVRAEYARVHALDPQPRWVVAQADTLLEFLGDPNEAAALYESVLHTDEALSARRGLIRRAWLEDDYARIAEHAAAILVDHPDDPEALYDLARARQGLGAYADALALFGEYAAVTVPYNLPDVVQGQAECLLLMGEADRAEDLLVTRVSSETDPELRGRYLESGVNAFSYHGDLTVALAFQQQLVRETDPDGEYSTYTAALYAQAELQSRVGDHGDALKTVEAMLARPDGQDGYHFRLKGDVLAAAGQPDEARAAYRKALKIDPDTPGVQDALAALPKKAGLLSRLFGR